MQGEKCLPLRNRSRYRHLRRRPGERQGCREDESQLGSDFWQTKVLRLSDFVRGARYLSEIAGPVRPSCGRRRRRGIFPTVKRGGAKSLRGSAHFHEILL